MLEAASDQAPGFALCRRQFNELIEGKQGRRSGVGVGDGTSGDACSQLHVIGIV